MKLFDVYPLQNIEPVRANGCHVFAKNGQQYLDFYGGHAVISIGHAHPHYVEKIQQQLNHISFYSNSVQNSLQVELAEKLGKLSGYEKYQLFLCNSGAEANENAFKLASFHTGRKNLVSLKKGFHGRTSLAVSATDNPKIIAPVNETGHVSFLEMEDLDTLEQLLKTETFCALVIEGIQGVAGINTPSASFLKGAAKLCQQYGTLLILDEIQSGYGRTGRFFAHQWAEVTPDIITVAKGMGNGFPIGGVLIHPSIKPWYGMLGTTFGGNHLACAAGIAVLDILDQENLTQNAEKIGNFLQTTLNEIDEVKHIKGKGLMIGLGFDFPIKVLRNTLLHDEHVFTGNAADPNMLRLLPPLNIGEEECLIFINKLKSALTKIKNNEQVHIS